MQHVAHRASDEIADLKSANALLHSLITNRDAEIERLRKAIPICCITGRIAGDSDACGDCDPCLAAYKVPEVVRKLLAEKDEWREKYGNAMAALDTMTEIGPA